MERKRLVLPLAATRFPRWSLVSSKSPGVAGTKAATFSDLWLERRNPRFPSLFPFPSLRQSHHEPRPPQGEVRPWAVWRSERRCRVGSDSRGNSTRKQMTGCEAVGVLGKAFHPPPEKSAGRATIPVQMGFWEA